MHARYVSLLLPILVACGTEGTGTVAITAYGETFIEDGIPASEVGDGWAVAFSRFEVSIQDVEVAGVLIAVPASIDLSASTSSQGHQLASAVVPAGAYTGASFTLAHIAIDGTATKGSDTKSFEWVFNQATRYTECETTTLVQEEATATFQITIHADHLLYDSLVADEPQVLFQSLAEADIDPRDDIITDTELSSAGIGAYDPGSEDGIDDLWAWLSAQAQTMGHVDGEGHCRATPAN